MDFFTKLAKPPQRNRLNSAIESFAPFECCLLLLRMLLSFWLLSVPRIHGYGGQFVNSFPNLQKKMDFLF